MSSPLTLTLWTRRTVMPQDDVTELEAREPGYLQDCLDDNWDWVQARLRKRYDVAAMAADPPRAVLRWLTKMTTKDAYDKRGYQASSDTDKSAIVDAATDARAEVKEAADAKDGLFDLPKLASSAASGISQGGPLGSSEQSPYTWTVKQACRGRDEDGRS